MSYLKCWKTKSGLINYKMIGDNGESLAPSGNQQFERFAGVIKNMKALAKFFGIGKKGSEIFQIEVRWTRNARSRTVIKTTTISI